MAVRTTFLRTKRSALDARRAELDTFYEQVLATRIPSGTAAQMVRAVREGK